MFVNRYDKKTFEIIEGILNSYVYNESSQMDFYHACPHLQHILNLSKFLGSEVNKPSKFFCQNFR